MSLNFHQTSQQPPTRTPSDWSIKRNHFLSEKVLSDQCATNTWRCYSFMLSPIFQHSLYFLMWNRQKYSSSHLTILLISSWCAFKYPFLKEEWYQLLWLNANYLMSDRFQTQWLRWSLMMILRPFKHPMNIVNGVYDKYFQPHSCNTNLL